MEFKNDHDRLQYLYAAFKKMPNSLPLRNAIAAIEARTGVEDGITPIDPLRFLDNLAASKPTSNEVRLSVESAKTTSLTQRLKRKLNLFWRAF